MPDTPPDIDVSSCAANRRQKQRGQSMTEYAIALVMVAIVVIATMVVVGKRTSAAFCNVSGALVGGGHTAGLLVDSGYDAYGNLGNGIDRGLFSDSTDSFGAHVPTLCVTQVVAAGPSAAALTNDGAVYTWGQTGYGQMGSGNNIGPDCGGVNALQACQAAPRRVTSLSGTFISVAAGGDPYCTNCAVTVAAVRSDGTVWEWGDNQVGEVGNGNNTGPDSCSGNQCQMTPAQAFPSNITTAVAVTEGFSHTQVLLRDGTIWGWGANSQGQLGNGSTSGAQLSPVQATTASGPLTGVTAISAGAHYTLALRNDGTVWAAGADDAGQLGNNTWDNGAHSQFAQIGNLSGITAISAGPYQAVALRNDGVIFTWGDQLSGMLGSGSANGTSNCNWGASQCTLVPTQVPNFSGVAAVAAGTRDMLAAKKDGTLYIWGEGSYGQLGNGSFSSNALSPLLVPGQNAALSMASAYASYVVVRSA